MQPKIFMIALNQVFRNFCATHAHKFVDAPFVENQGEQNLEYYELFQKYLKLYEAQMSEFIESLGASDRAFYEQLQDVQNDPNIKDKKLVKFVNYLIACTDYPAFYKLMVRAAKKLVAAESESKGTSADIGRGSKEDGAAGSKAEGKYSGDDDDRGHEKASYK